MARCATAVGDAGKARRPNNRQTGTLSSVAAVLRKLPHERSHKPAASQKQLAEAGAAGRHGRGAEGHQWLDVGVASSSEYRRRVRLPIMRGRYWHY